MIIEGICTTRNVEGMINVAPMGPEVDQELTSFVFRPFQSSTTFANLRHTRMGVFHVVDDVELIARTAVGCLDRLPELDAAQVVDGTVLRDACRWYEFEVISIDDSSQRTEIRTRVVHIGRYRDSWGFNRAKHAVLEAAILVTRLEFLSRQEVTTDLQRLRRIVDKTGGEQEHAAFEFLIDFAESFWDQTGECT